MNGLEKEYLVKQIKSNLGVKNKKKEYEKSNVDLKQKYGNDILELFEDQDEIDEKQIKDYITVSFHEKLVSEIEDNENLKRKNKNYILNNYTQILEKNNYKVYDNMEEIILQLIEDNK